MNHTALEFIITSLIKEGFTISTLGGESEIEFASHGDELYCVTRSGAQIPISQESIRMTCERYENLKRGGQSNSLGTPLHRATGHYNQPIWADCPNNIACPYIAAVIAYLEDALNS